MIGVGAEKQAVWIYALAYARKGSVELNPTLLAVQIGMSKLEAIEALKFLCAPDPESRSKEADGARLIKSGEYLYEVVNWDHYQGLKDEDDRREWERLRKAEWRARQKSTTCPGQSGTNGDSHGFVPQSPPLDINVNRDTKSKSKNGASAPTHKPSRPSSFEELGQFVTAELGLTENDALALWEHWEGNGWKNGGRPIVKWKSTASNWLRRGFFFPSIQQPRFQK